MTEIAVTQTDHLASLFLITSIGKSLVKKGLVSSQDIIDQLESIKGSITHADAKLLKLEVSNLIRSVSDWEAK